MNIIQNIRNFLDDKPVRSGSDGLYIDREGLIEILNAIDHPKGVPAKRTNQYAKLDKRKNRNA